MANVKFDFTTIGVCLVGVLSITIFLLTYDKYYFPIEEHHHYVYINTSDSVFEVDEKFLSIALDTSFMKISFYNLNLSDWALLEKFANSLTPAYIRLGGTAADQVLFTLNDKVNEGNDTHYGTSLKDINFSPQDYLNISGHDWLKFTKFVCTSGLRLLLDLNVLLRNGSRWDNRNAMELLTFSESHDIPMDFQLGNEPNSFKHVFNVSIPAGQLGQDFNSLRETLSMFQKFKNSKLVGPDVTRPKFLDESSQTYLREFLANVRNLSAVSWHQYYLNGRTATLDEFIDPQVFDILAKQIAVVSEIARNFSSEIPIWLTETSSAYGGGAPGLSNRFVASFLWLDKLGLAAKMGMKVVVRQTLYKGNYSLIDDDLFPLPDYWISLVHKRLVGRKVLQVSFAKQTDESHLRLYSHCLKNYKNVTGGVVLFGMNLSNSSEYIIPGGLKEQFPVTSLIFTSEKGNLTSRYILLNGRRLEPNQEDVNFFEPMQVKLPLCLPPYSLAFWVFSGKREGICQNTEM